jgi:hypothetical protein
MVILDRLRMLFKNYIVNFKMACQNPVPLLMGQFRSYALKLLSCKHWKIFL